MLTVITVNSETVVTKWIVNYPWGPWDIFIAYTGFATGLELNMPLTYACSLGDPQTLWLWEKEIYLHFST